MKEIDRLNNELQHWEKRHQQDIMEFDNKLSGIRLAIENHQKDVRKILDKVFTDGILLELYGIIMFVSGIVYATVPDCLAALFA